MTQVSTLAALEYLVHLRLWAEDEGSKWVDSDTEEESVLLKGIEDAARQPVLDVLEWIVEAELDLDAVIPVNLNAPYLEETIGEFIERLRS